MKNNDNEEYKTALKMLIDTATEFLHLYNESGPKELATNYLEIEDKLIEAVAYGKSTLNDIDEQTEHSLNVDEICIDETSDSDEQIEHANEHTSIVPEPKPEPSSDNEFQRSLFGDEPESESEPEPDHKSETENKSVKEKDEKFEKDLPFELPVVAPKSLDEELKRDVEEGLLDKETADKVVEVASSTLIPGVPPESDYYRFESDIVYVLRPEEMNIETTAPTFFANFLVQEYGQNLNEINILDMKLDYKNHIFRSLTWTSKYGVKYQLNLKKYIAFLEQYVL